MEIMKKFLKLVIGLLLIILITRLSFFDIFRVPSDSMKNALMAGDLIIINKTFWIYVLTLIFKKKKNTYKEFQQTIITINSITIVISSVQYIRENVRHGLDAVIAKN